MHKGRLIFSTLLCVGVAGFLCQPSIAQSSLSFYLAGASDKGFPSTTGNVSYGMAATMYNGNLYTAFVDDGQLHGCTGALSVQGYYDHSGTIDWTQVDPSNNSCNLPYPDGQPQMTVWNGQIYISYAETGDDQLVIANSSDGAAFNYLKPGIQVYPGPAIGTFNGVLYVAYQQHNSSTHYLGIATSADGVHFTNTIHSDIRIGHSPAIVQFGNKLVVANFCQCDSHYLDVRTSTDGVNFALTEITSQTLSNLSAPSLAVSNGVLALAYVRNGTNDIYTSTSYDAVHWTAAQRQSNNLSFSLGGSALAVRSDNWVYVVYESERALSWDANSGPHQEFYSTAAPLQ